MLIHLECLNTKAQECACLANINRGEGDVILDTNMYTHRIPSQPAGDSSFNTPQPIASLGSVLPVWHTILCCCVNIQDCEQVSDNTEEKSKASLPTGDRVQLQK